MGIPTVAVRKARKARLAMVKAVAREDALRLHENSRQYADESMYYYAYVYTWENVARWGIRAGIR